MMSAIAAVMLTAGAATSARAQTVVNLTNLDPTESTGFSSTTAGNLSSGTSLDLLNTTTALSNGGLFGGAVSNQTQQATNQLNTIGLTSLGAAAPVVLGNQTPITGTPTVTINTIASAYNSTGVVGSINAGSSTTINNTNAAISGGVNQIVGAPSTLNALYSGGYGPTAGNVQVGGNQIGINTINGVGAAFAAGTAVTLSQLPGAPTPGGSGTGATIGTAPIIQGGALNMSTVNTLLAYTGAGAASVNGSGSTAGSPGAQTAVNTFNTATLVGDIGVAAQQKADGLNALDTALQSVNRAMAYSMGATSANVDPSVTNLNQNAAIGINALNLLAGASGATTLSGTQSNGNNTVAVGPVSGGTTPAAVATNQIVATTQGANGFLPAGTTGVGGTQTAAWNALASQVGASGAPVPGSLTISSRLTGAVNGMDLGSGIVNIGNVGQSINLTNNTVSAGTTAAPVAVTFGPAGFAQTAGNIGIASNAAGLNNATADTGVGATSLNAVTQAFQSANNTFQGTGNISGALSQTASGLNFSAGSMGAPGSAGLALNINGGSGQYNYPAAPGVGSNNGPYQVDLGIAVPTKLNNAVASTVYGTSSVTGLSQAGNTFANVASTSGTIDPGAASTLAQTLGAIAGYGGTYNGGATNYARAEAAFGNSAMSTVNQGLSLTANAVSGTAGVNGSVAQSSGTTVDMQPTNYLGSLSQGQGSAALASNTQTNFTSLNSIASNGALGSATSPAAFSQQSGPTNTAVSGFNAANAIGANTTFNNPSNSAEVYSYLGAGGSATSNGLTQASALNVNTITGGTAAGTGITGNSTQTSTGRSSTIANLATASSMDSFPPNSVGASQPSSVMSGNATMLNTAQSAAQSLNTMSLAGANNGILNQATFGATNQTTGNKIAATSAAGYAVTTGAQLATNAVNVISAR